MCTPRANVVHGRHMHRPYAPRCARNGPRPRPPRGRCGSPGPCQGGQSANVLAISWQAQQRLRCVWRRLDGERGNRRTIVAVAVARELAGFCWALARAD